MAGGRHTSVLFKIGLCILVTVSAEDRGRETRDEKGVYKAARESVKNRQLHRQKQDAESIHLLKVRGGKSRLSEKRPVVLTGAINSQEVH